MKYLLLALPFLFLGCKKLGDKPQQETDILLEEEPLSIINKGTNIPEGALTADFFGNSDSVYAYIKKIDPINEITHIGFENEKLPESIGAELQLLKLKNFGNDILLVNAKLKDTNFNEYYLFVWEDSIWKQPINRFDIHKSNMSDTLIPIQNDPKDSTQVLRYYSVFNMDRDSEKKFRWKLMRERVSVKE